MLDTSLKLFQHLAVFRESVDVVLAEDFVAIQDHIEDAAAALNHLRFDARFALDCCRQTDGFGFVVSLYAVGD